MISDSIVVDNIQIHNNKLDVFYHATGRVCKYINNNTHFFSHYSCDIGMVPDSIAVIPFVVNVLPIIWVTDSILELPELDSDFFQSIEEFKKGYIKMYPMIAFGGEVRVVSLVKNVIAKSENDVAAFFSGGVDAFSTLINHISEKPILVTVRGADIKLDDVDGWSIVTNHVNQVASEYGLNVLLIESNFRYFLNEARLNELIGSAKDNWWHGFQHGIGLIGLSFPAAYTCGFAKIYIASSYTKEDRYTCASDPLIDNYLRFANAQIFHDGYEYSRQKKIECLCSYVKKTSKTMNLRVCYMVDGGRNCCRCEKCYRTITGIIAEGHSPLNYGFNINSTDLNKIIHDLKWNIFMSSAIVILWKDIQKKFIQNKDCIEENKILNFMLSYNFDKINNRAKWFKHYLNYCMHPLLLFKRISKY